MKHYSNRYLPLVFQAVPLRAHRYCYKKQNTDGIEMRELGEEVALLYVGNTGYSVR
jgi:hypothetical protein